MRRLHDAFDETVANFSALTSDRLAITSVAHQAMVKLDEKGTEAAAATAVSVADAGVASAGPPPKDIAFNRPFFYFLRDVATGTVLFIGRVADPTAP